MQDTESDELEDAFESICDPIFDEVTLGRMRHHARTCLDCDEDHFKTTFQFPLNWGASSKERLCHRWRFVRRQQELRNRAEQRHDLQVRLAKHENSSMQLDSGLDSIVCTMDKIMIGNNAHLTSGYLPIEEKEYSYKNICAKLGARKHSEFTLACRKSGMIYKIGFGAQGNVKDGKTLLPFQVCECIIGKDMVTPARFSQEVFNECRILLVPRRKEGAQAYTRSWWLARGCPKWTAMFGERFDQPLQQDRLYFYQHTTPLDELGEQYNRWSYFKDSQGFKPYSKENSEWLALKQDEQCMYLGFSKIAFTWITDLCE